MRRGPRPRVAGAPASVRVVVRVTEAEAEELRSSAKSARQPLGAHVRDLALGSLADDGADFKVTKKK